MILDMKHIFMEETGQNRPHHPFWVPNTLGGWMLRTILFLTVLVTALFLLSSVEPQGTHRFDPDDPYIPAPTPEPDIPEPAPDTPGKVVWPKPGVNPVPNPNLPDDKNNRIPPADQDLIIPDPDSRYIVSDRLNVILDSDAGNATFNHFAEQFKNLYPSEDYNIVYYNVLTKLLQLRVPPYERDRLIEILPEQISDISFVVFKEELFGGILGKVSDNTTFDTPADPAFEEPDNLWYMDLIQAYDAWDITMGEPGVTVAIVDSYFELEHDELKGKWKYPISFENGTTYVNPVAGVSMGVASHGTHVASIAVGTANNGSGACGIAPNCKFIPVSLGSQITTMKILEGILYSIYHGADVINLSLGAVFSEGIDKLSLREQLFLAENVGIVEENVWDYVFNLADKHNCIIVWAGGNDDLLIGVDCSKRSDITVRVSAVDEKLRKASFSNFGYKATPEDVEYSTVSAPGENIYGAVVYNDYASWDGTSMSAPIVSGTIALMKSVYNGLTAREAVEIIQKTSKPLTDDNIGGLIQIRDALEMVQAGMLEYDDLMADHSKLLGLWEATELLNVINNEGEETGQKVHVYMQFNDLKSGTLIYEEIPSEEIYSAPLSVKFTDDSLEISQLEPAVSEGTQETFTCYDFLCTSDQDGFLSCNGSVRDEPSSETSFNLRKVKLRR